MSFGSNKFTIIIIVTILLAGATGWYLSGMKTPDQSSVATRKMDAEKVGGVINELNNLTND